MNLLKILLAAGLNVESLKRILEAGKAAAPDLAPDVDAILAQLDEPTSPAAILALAADLLPEVKNIVSGHIEPKDHAGDFS